MATVTRILAVLLFIAPAAGRADEGAEARDRPRSSLSLVGTGGSAEYRGIALDGRFALGDSPWRLGAGISSSRTDDVGSRARELRAGAEWWARESWRFRGRAYRRDEGDGIVAGGASLGVDLDVELTANPELLTTLSLELGGTAYRVDDATPTSALRFARRAAPLTQINVTLALNQTFARDWSADVSATWYGYSRNPAEMSAQLEARRASVTPISGLLPGLPKSSYGLGLQWSGTAGLAASAGVAWTRTAVSAASSLTTSLAGAYDVTPRLTSELGCAWTTDGIGLVQRQLTLGVTWRW